MNEITHEQARSLMQAEIDGMLDDSGLGRLEWANLHAHLETCAECRAEERRLRGLQRELHSALRAGLDAHEPPPVVVQPIIEDRAVKQKTRRRVTRTAVIIPAALLLIALFVWLRPDQLIAALLDPWGTAEDTFYASFDGQIVFESRRGGNRDLYLLQGGNFPVNLTDHPAEDTDPVWSPDGTWIAFLSDRGEDPLNAHALEVENPFASAGQRATQQPSPGKREVFALLPGSGQAPIQLSAAPATSWSGPLSWSADGQSLALNGRLLPALMSEQQSALADSWLYTLRIDGSGAQRVAGTRGASQAHYAPAGRWLGLSSTLGDASQMLFGQMNQSVPPFYSLISQVPTNEGEYRPGAGFAWSPGGGELAYIVEGPYLYRGGRYQPANRAVSQLRRVVGFPGEFPARMTGMPLVELPLVNGLRAVAWSPDGMNLVMLTGSVQDPCWSLLVGRVPQVQGTMMELLPVEGVCAEGPLTSRPWTPDGRWLVFNGRWNGSNPAIYALDVQQAVERPNWAPLVARLTQPFGLDRKPQVQPSFPNLGIAPVGVEPQAAPAPLTPELVAEAPGRLAVTTLADNGSVEIHVLSPGEGRPQPVMPPAGDVYRPVWSPDGAQIAMLGSTPGADMHLFVTGAPPEGIITQPELLDLTPNGMRNISTPSWSPDGLQMAAIVTTPVISGGSAVSTRTALSVFAADGDPRETFNIPSGGAGFLEAAAWSPPGAVWGERIAALVSGRPFDSAYRYDLALALVDLAEAANERVTITYLSVDGLPPESVHGLAWEPDGRRVAVLAFVEENGLVQPRVAIFRASADSEPFVSRNQWFSSLTVTREQSVYMGQRFETRVARDDGLRWRPGRDEMSFVVNEIGRGRVVLYPAAGGGSQVLLEWEEPIYQHAWSPDGEWLAYSADSGVWLLHMPSYEQGAAPYRLLSQGGWGLSWGD